MGLSPTQGLWAADDEQLIPFVDSPKFDPGKPRLPWDETTSWITPEEHFFWVGHYGTPAPIDPADWKLDISGLVEKPRSFTLAALKARPKKEYTITLECSGNPASGGLIGNARWAGTPLAPILKECGLKPEAVEVVFFAADEGTEKIRNGEYKQNFARTLTARDALRLDAMLAYEFDGKPLPNNHGAPVRLVVPGWYGVAWVKWLNRIEVLDRPYLNRFMGRDYVTIRGEQHGTETIWRETSVGKMNLKSVPGRVTKKGDGTFRIAGAAWSDGTAIKSVEVKIDDGPWKPARITPNQGHPYAWSFWSYEWTDAQPGEHTISSRATDIHGRIQPAPDDPFITLKKTYWEANQQAVRKIQI
jgi:DMSO/TMAO reductase YedYZ molybdopterin-dependent catalytic subunit